MPDCKIKEEEAEAPAHTTHAKDVPMGDVKPAISAMYDSSPHLSSIASIHSSPVLHPKQPAGSESPLRTGHCAPATASPPHSVPPLARGEARGGGATAQTTNQFQGTTGSDHSGSRGSEVTQWVPKHEDSSPATSASSRTGDERTSPMPHLSLATHKLPASATRTKSAEPHVVAMMDVPATQPPGCSRVGGHEWVRRRKNETQDLAFRSGMSPHENQVANVCKAVQRLQAVLPLDAKARFLIEMRRYGAGDVSPEEFAEVIKGLVDEYNVVVPLSDMPVGGWYRPERNGVMVPLSKGKQSRANKRSGGGGRGPAVKRQKSAAGDMPSPPAAAAGRASSPGGKGKGAVSSSSKKGVAATSAGGAKSTMGKNSQQPAVWDLSRTPPAEGRGGDENSAWEALLSVCSADICA